LLDLFQTGEPPKPGTEARRVPHKARIVRRGPAIEPVYRRFVRAIQREMPRAQPITPDVAVVMESTAETKYSLTS
jgi:hypothetical protein